MRAISGRLAGMSLSERMRLPCIGQERADLVVAALREVESEVVLRKAPYAVRDAAQAVAGRRLGQWMQRAHQALVISQRAAQ